jgi:outer membrane biosynthesis protein TonB
VVLQAIVDTTGRVEPESIEVTESTAEIFEAPARRFLEGSVFTPGRVGGRPARVLIRIPVNFRPAGG